MFGHVAVYTVYWQSPNARRLLQVVSWDLLRVNFKTYVAFTFSQISLESKRSPVQKQP